MTTPYEHSPKVARTLGLWDRIAQTRRHYVETGQDALTALIDATRALDSALDELQHWYPTPAWAAIRAAAKAALAPYAEPEPQELDDDGAPIERTVPGGFAKASQDDL